MKSTTKPKHNKVKVGQRVEVSKEALDWFVNHLVWCHGQTVKDDRSYSENEKEIKPTEFNDVYALLHYHLNNKKVRGTATHYGAEDDNFDFKRKNVYVEMDFNLPHGKHKHGTYFSEKDLKVIRYKKRV